MLMKFDNVNNSTLFSSILRKTAQTFGGCMFFVTYHRLPFNCFSPTVAFSLFLLYISKSLSTRVTFHGSDFAIVIVILFLQFSFL